MNNLLSNKKFLIALGVASLLFFVYIIYSSFSTSAGDIDKQPREGRSEDYTKVARIVGGEELYQILRGDRRYDSLSADLHLFGKTAYSAYASDPNRVVGFQITSDVDQKDNKVTFDGRFGSSKNKVKITIDILGNDQQKVSIEDQKTKLSINDRLPSNSEFNAYVATLPVITTDYTVEYVKLSGKVLVQLNEKRPELGEKFYTDLNEKVKDNSIDRSRIEILFPVESFGQ